MKKAKIIISVLCAAIMTISIIYLNTLFGSFTQALAAVEKSEADSSMGINKDSITMQGNNSFGNMLAETLSEEQQKQENNNGNNIFEATIEKGQVQVSFQATEDAVIVAGIYTENGEEMLASGMSEILKGESEAYIDISAEKMPQYFLLRVFMVNKETLAPLCSFYESPNYTQEMQEFFAKTVDDFEQEKVVNLDEDKTNNFAVYKDNVIIIEAGDNINQIVSIDEKHGIYIIENADNIILSLKQNDIFSYQYNEETLLIVKIKEIEKNGTTVTITADESSLEEVFSYVKIDSQAGLEKAEIDESTCGEGIIYNGLIEWEDEEEIQTYAYDVKDEKSIAASYTFKEGKVIDNEGNHVSTSVKVNGEAEVEIKNSIKIYISQKYKYLEYKFDFAVKVSIGAEAKIEGNLKLAEITIRPIPILEVKFTPSIVLEIEAKIELSGELKGEVGFWCDNDDRGKNRGELIRAVSFEPKIEAEGSIFLGLSLEPQVGIISEHLAKLEFQAQAGVEIKAKWTIAEPESTSEKHDCEQCVEGEINAKIKLSVEAQLVDSEKLKFKNSKEFTFKLTDFYYSITFRELGWGTCPHISYKTTVTIKDKDGNPIEGVLVNDEYITDEHGTAVCYLAKGTHRIKAVKEGYCKTEKDIIITNIQQEANIVINIERKQKVAAISLGYSHSAAVTENGGLYMWGENSEGQLGTGDTNNSNIPVKIMDDIVYVALGTRFSAAISKDGSLYMWGSNNMGQLGNGTTVSSLVPIKVLENVAAVSLGSTHAGALTKDGSLYMWGNNNMGQLGNGTTETCYAPIKIMDDVIQISMNSFCSGAVKRDGSLYVWGDNFSGQLTNLGGSGGMTPHSTPIKIMDDIAAVSHGEDHSGAITLDGTLYTWGANYSGQLGDGSKVAHLEPQSVISNITKISFGNSSGAITIDGKLYSWGIGNFNMIPLLIMENVSLFSTAGQHRGAVTTDGSLYMWGNNDSGQLGNGNNIEIYQPEEIIIPEEKENLKAYLFKMKEEYTSRLNKVILSASYEHLIPNRDYIFCQIKSDAVENFFDSDNLLYIAQATTDKNGNISFSYCNSNIDENTITKLSEAGKFINETQESQTIYGDVNSDGKVDSKDAVSIKKYLAKYSGLSIDKEAADVNGDSEVDSKDAVRLLRHLAGYEVTLGK